MPKRAQEWQLAKARTAKRLQALPLCELCAAVPGYGFTKWGSWLCVKCALAQRERRT